MPGADCVWALVALWRALNEGDNARAEAIHAPLSDLCSPLETVDAFLYLQKLLLVKQGIFFTTRSCAVRQRCRSLHCRRRDGSETENSGR